MAKQVSFDAFMERWPKQYKQDQHVTIIGPTGCGKTTLGSRLVECRKLVVVTGVKHRDDTMMKLVKSDTWHRAQTWKRKPKTAERVVLWPKEDDLDKVMDVHHKVFGDMFRAIYREGYWCIWSDELTYLADHAGLRKMIRQMYILARSNMISLVGSAQRPAFVPIEAYSQASHLFLFRTGHEGDLGKVGSFNGANAKQISATVETLPEHHFLHVNLLTREQTVSCTSR